VITQEPTVVPSGTTIAVKNLFFNIPARRNFLKSNTVETRHIIDEFHRVALAHSNIAFTLLHNGTPVFNLPESNVRQRIVNIFGNKTKEKLVPVEETTDILKIDGFVIKPDFAKKSRGEQFFFVNNRFIKSAYLNHAVQAAFEGLIKNGVHPGYFLFLEVDPKSIDINIHPTKTEIKFDDEHALYAMLRATVKHSLGQFSIAPVLDFNRESALDTPYDYANKSPVAPTIEVDRSFNPFSPEPKQKNINFPFKREKKTAHWESLYVGLKDEEIPASQHTPETHLTFESDEVTGTLFEDDSTINKQLTFQLQNKYIISPIKSGMMIIHQHLAHQRVLYEELLKNITLQQAVSQQLLFPLEMHFSIPDMKILQKIQEQLEHTGFVFETFGEEKVSISGIPVALVESQASIVLEQLIQDIIDEVPDAGFSQNDLLVRSMAKSMAVKTGVSLNSQEREHLVNQLFMCKEPSISPSNKPVIITLDAYDLDKKFM
ncbi:MAG: DNA mismatch repair protein MutL, partial [Patiriisocius sp.]